MAGAPATSRPERCRTWSQQTHDTKLSWQVRKPNTPFYHIHLKEGEVKLHSSERSPVVCLLFHPVSSAETVSGSRHFSTKPIHIYYRDRAWKLLSSFSDMKIFPSFHVFQIEEPPHWCFDEVVGKFSTLSIIGLLDNRSIFLQSCSSPKPRGPKYFALTSTVHF